MRHFMQPRYLLAAAAVFAASASLAPLPAEAQQQVPVIASQFRANMCLTVAQNFEIRIWPCRGTPNQRFGFRQGTYGQIGVLGNCLSTNAGGSETPLIMSPCNNNVAQRWAFGPRQRLANEQGWCADIEREGGEGSRVIAYRCTGRANQAWRPAWVTPVR
jgi:hypothetical protein